MLALHTHSRHRKKYSLWIQEFSAPRRRLCCVSEGVLTLFFFPFLGRSDCPHPPWQQQHFFYLISFHNSIVCKKRAKKGRREKVEEREKFSDFLISFLHRAENAHCWTKWIRWCLSVIDLFEHFWNGEMVKPWRHARAVGGRDCTLRMSRKRGNVENDEGEWEREVEWWYEGRNREKERSNSSSNECAKKISLWGSLCVPQ